MYSTTTQLYSMVSITQHCMPCAQNVLLLHEVPASLGYIYAYMLLHNSCLHGLGVQILDA